MEVPHSAAGGRWKAVRLQGGMARAGRLGVVSLRAKSRERGLRLFWRPRFEGRLMRVWRRGGGNVLRVAVEWLWCCRTFGDCRAGLGRAAAVLPGAAGDHSSRRRVSTALRNSSTPSAGTLPRVQVGWFVGWLKASGWGMRPRMRPVGSVRPAIPRGEPLGLAG